ncbi:hypothetical protein D1007_01624 [Hordeum vulgare]|nr:hypothetical protein D1007_01624 [Hordeum vulgare]
MTSALLAGGDGLVSPERKPLEDAFGTPTRSSSLVSNSNRLLPDPASRQSLASPTMAPASKQKPEAQGPTPSPPLLECALPKDADLVPVLPWTATDSNEHGQTPIWPGAMEKWPTSKAPNSILILSVFAFYGEAFVGVRPSVALFCHFFSLRLHDGAHSSACVSFVAAQSGNLFLKAGKKVENFGQHWVLMTLKDANPWMDEPKGLSEKTSAWSSVKLSNPRAAPVLERFSRNISAKRMTGGMIVKEFLAQRLAPLQAHSRPLWDYRAGDDELRLWS